MNVSVAVSSNWGIGHKNDLLFRISPDLKRFKKLTMGKAVVMGHNTFKSLPNQKPLPDRKNIVMSRKPNLRIPGVLVANSKEQVMEMVSAKDIFIIGGEQIYKLFLNDCTRIYLTKVYDNPPADVFFPNLDTKPEWSLAYKSELLYDNGYEFMYCEYINNKKETDYGFL